MINWIKKIKKFFKKKEKPTVIEWVDKNGVKHAKYTIPVGNLSKKEAEKTLGDLMSLYKEEIEWDDSIGELTINGSASLVYNKTYFFPSPDYSAGSPKIELIENKKI